MMAPSPGSTLRLVWPQWQGTGTGTSSVRTLAPEFPPDVDTMDSDEIVLGLGAEPHGLTSAEVRRIVTDLQSATDVVGLTIAEFIPRQVMHLQQILRGFPLIGPASSR